MSGLAFGAGSRRGESGTAIRWLTTYIPITLFVGVTLFPFYWMFLTSLKSDPELISVRSVPFIVKSPTLEHYVRLLQGTLFLRWAWNSLLVTVVSTLISLACGIASGYALARLRFPGSQFLGLAIFVTYLVPQTLLFLPLSSIITKLGVMDSLWALILTYPTRLIPFCTMMLMGYFQSIPRELEECAMIDGVSRLQVLTRIIIPLSIPGILSAGIFAFTLSWNEYMYALVFTSSTMVKTLPIGVTSELIKGDVFFWGQLMAGALLASVPVALIYAFFVEHYVAGLTAGSVKG